MSSAPSSRPSITSLALAVIAAALTIVIVVMMLVDGRLSAGVDVVGAAIIVFGVGEGYWLARRSEGGPGLGGWLFVVQVILVLCWVLVAVPQQLGGAS